MQTQPHPRGHCARCGVLYEARALRAHVEVCDGQATWPGIGPKPRQAPVLSDGKLPEQPQQRLDPRGTCSKCGSIYAGEIRGHMQHCNGKPAWPGAGPRPIAVAAPKPRATLVAPSPQAPQAPAAEIAVPAKSKSTGDCSGCGKHFAKGLHLHQRACPALRAKQEPQAA